MKENNIKVFTDGSLLQGSKHISDGKLEDLIRYINSSLSTQWSRGNRVFPTPTNEDVVKVCSDVIDIINPLSYVKIHTGGKEYIFESESEMYDWYVRIKKLTPSLDMKTFFEIIHQPNFSIEGYEISKQISIEDEKNTNKEDLKKKYEQYMSDK